MTPIRSTCLAAAAALIIAAPAAAVTQTLSLTGDLGTTTSVTFDTGNSTLTQATLVLTGFTPFSIAAGDTIEYSLALTGFMFNVAPFDYFVIPAATAGPFGQLFGVNFQREDDLQPINASATGQTTLSGVVGDITGVSLDGACSNCLTAILGRAPGPFGGFGFHGLDGFTTVALDAPFTVDRITLSYQIQAGFAPAGVPETGSWVLLIAGFGLVGATLRKRRFATVAA